MAAYRRILFTNNCMTATHMPIFMRGGVEQKCNYEKAASEETVVTPVSSAAMIINLRVWRAAALWSSCVRSWINKMYARRNTEGCYYTNQYREGAVDE